MKKRTIFYCAILLLCFYQIPLWATLSAKLDRATVGLDETFTLLISSDQDIDGTPDLAPLNKDFQVLGVSTNSQFSVVNGKKTYQKQWMVSLLAKKQGKLTIPAITIENETTQPISIDIKQEENITQDKATFIEASTDKKTVYVDGALRYTVKVFYRDGDLRGTLSSLDLADADVHPLGQGTSYTANIKGDIYKVFEQSYVISPHKAGQLAIPAQIFNGEQVSSQQQLMNPFFASGGKPLRLRSNTINIEVKPIPSSAKVYPWLPAKSVVLEQNWSVAPKDWQAGQPVIRTINLKAIGVFANQLPDLTLQHPKTVNVYPEKPQIDNATDGNNIYAKHIEKIVYIPTQAGMLDLPEVTLHWWNTQTDQLETITLPAQTVNVKAAPTVLNQEPSTSTHTTLLMPMPVKTKMVSEKTLDYWQWLTGLFLILWLLTLLAWWRHYRRWSKKEAHFSLRQNNKMLEKTSRKAIKTACQQQDLNNLHQALIAWAQLTWPQKSMNTLGDIIAQDLAEDFKQALQSLDQKLYHHNTDEYDFNLCWDGFKQQLKWHPTSEGSKKDDLPPLHPE